MQSFEALLSSDAAVAVLLVLILAVVSNLAVVYRVFKLFYGCPNRRLMPYEVQLSEYVVPAIALLQLIYFPFL